MKILVAINSVNHKTVGDKALRWCGRLGLDVKLFVPKNKRKKFLETVDDANYHYYLALDKDETVVSRTDAETYAKQHDIDLLLTIPESLSAWRKGTEFKDHEIKLAYEAITSARGQFSRKEGMNIKQFANGAIMKRVSNL